MEYGTVYQNVDVENIKRLWSSQKNNEVTQNLAE